MEPPKTNTTRIYLMSMAAFWFVFGLIATFYPALMDLFHTENGTNAETSYSRHIWLHDGLDILAITVLLFALSREAASRNMVRAAAIAALLVTIAIVFSLLATSYWNLLFLVPGLCCFAFAVWGFRISAKIK